MTQVILIAAVGRNGEIGRNGELPWHLPDDLKAFREKTMGHPVVMGRKTAQSIGKALPGRTNIVVTRTCAPFPDQFGADSVEEAIHAATEIGTGKVFIIGGGEIYRQAIPMATHYDITQVDMDVPDADTFFPTLFAR